MMDVTNFDKVRLGRHWPMVLDVAPLDSTDEYGLLACFYLYKDKDDTPRRIELRWKKDSLGLFLFRFQNQELPEWWRDSELTWSLNDEEVR